MAMNMACKLVLSYWNKFREPILQVYNTPVNRKSPGVWKESRLLWAYWQRLPAPLFQLGVLKQPLLEVGLKAFIMTNSQPKWGESLAKPVPWLHTWLVGENFTNKKLQVPKMQGSMNLILGMGFPLHKPYVQLI